MRCAPSVFDSLQEFIALIMRGGAPEKAKENIAPIRRCLQGGLAVLAIVYASA